jgi:CheY-like chemotaxis protein
MKLDYKILWLDDKMDVILDGHYDSEIKKHLIEQGFNPIVITVKDEKEFFNKLDDSFDLILTDYHLNDTANNTRDGDLIIKEVREKNSIFTEIMFYSAQGEVVDTVKLDRITFVDTRKSIIRDHNEAVIDRAIKLIDLTLKKFQHVISMRGMIMNETSTIDADMLEIVTDYIQNTNSTKVKNRIFDELIGFHSRKLGDSEKFKKNDRIDSVLKDPLLISSSQRANAIEEIIKLLGTDNFIDDLKVNIIKVRNDFAHAVYVKDKVTGREYFLDKKDGIDFNEEKCKEIRINISKHKENIQKLKNKLAK